MSIGFSSASHDFTNRLHDFLGSNKSVCVSQKEYRGLVKLSFGFGMSHSQSVLVGEKIYGNAPQHIRFEDKYLRFLEGKKLWESYQAGCKNCGKFILTDDLCYLCWWKQKKENEPDLKCLECDELEHRIGLCKQHYWHLVRVRKAKKAGLPPPAIVPRKHYRKAVEAMAEPMSLETSAGREKVQALIDRKSGPAGASGIKGVRIHKKSGLWQATVHHKGKGISVGYFKTPEEAERGRLDWIKKNADVLVNVVRKPPPPRKHAFCSICGKQAMARKLCEEHYSVWYRAEKAKKAGKDFESRRRVLPDGAKCSVDGCSEKPKAHGLCESHYSQKRYQDRKTSAENTTD